jgi:hypothetical protein
MQHEAEAYFECRADRSGGWEIIVTWGHCLRERVLGLQFVSEHDANQWILLGAALWLESGFIVSVSSTKARSPGADEVSVNAERSRISRATSGPDHNSQISLDASAEIQELRVRAAALAELIRTTELRRRDALV